MFKKEMFTTRLEADGRKLRTYQNAVGDVLSLEVRGIGDVRIEIKDPYCGILMEMAINRTVARQLAMELDYYAEHGELKNGGEG